MAVKTRASLPIDNFKHLENYDRLLVDIFHGNPTPVIGLSQLRVENLVGQMKDIMKSDSNHDTKNVYTLLSTFEATFVLLYDNEKGNDTLWISRPLPRSKLLLAMFFVLSIQLYQLGHYEEMSEDVLILMREIGVKPNSSFQNDSLNSSNSSLTITTENQNDSNEIHLNSEETKYSRLNAESFLEIWNKGPRKMIGCGRTCCVFKVSFNNKMLAYKMINLFKNAEGSLEEIENENNVMRWINYYTKLSIVPTVHYYGNISVYRTLVTTYIDGLCFDEFTEMNPLMREACRKSVQDLHANNILHGDLQPWNFIIKTFSAISYKAYIIDFGRAKLNADEESLAKEYEYFCIAAEINAINTSML